MRLLSALSHENVVRLEEIVTSGEGGEGDSSGGGSSGVPSTIYMVFEFCDGDLNDVLKAVREGRLRLTPSHLRCFTRQMLEGLYYIHENRIIHRDIKGEPSRFVGGSTPPDMLLDTDLTDRTYPRLTNHQPATATAANILVTRDCRVKIGDWGLGRAWGGAEKERYTDNVCTLWYRAPELLMGVANYTLAVDVWSIGCVRACMRQHVHLLILRASEKLPPTD